MKYGIGASVLRKEDDRFLRGRGQYVGDFRLPGMRDVAFVRSPVAHARLKRVHIPEQFRSAVFTASDLVGVMPIVSAPALKGFKRSAEPILATASCAMSAKWSPCAWRRPALKLKISPARLRSTTTNCRAVTDMLSACAPGSPLVHEEWGDNIFVEFSEGGPIEDLADTAAIKVMRTIRTSRHCMFPMEGRGVVAYRDARLRCLTLVTSTQFPHSVQTGLCECLGLGHGNACASSRPMSAAASAIRDCSAGRGRARLAGACRSTIRCAGWRTAGSI